MGDYFKPWRRRFGLVTLGMALAFMGAWVRSLPCEDQIKLLVSKSTPVGIYSSQGNIFLIRYLSWNNAGIRGLPRWTSSKFHSSAETLVSSQVFSDSGYRVTGKKFQRRLLTVEYFEYLTHDGLIIPYWSITFPLTVVSCWLLLSKPRQSTQKKIIEPATAGYD